MLRSTIVKMSLATSLVLGAYLAVAAEAPDATASEAAAATNVGFVLYTKSYAPGTLNARWLYGTQYGGPGIATGGPVEGYAGRYHVRYFLDSGEFSDEYDLVIEESDRSYEVSWLTNGVVQAVGVGMEVENGLAVGWRRVED